MDSIARVKALADDRGISMYSLSQNCDIPYSTLKSSKNRHSPLSVEMIEIICNYFNIPLYEFFMTDSDWDEIESYALRRAARKGNSNG